MNTVELFWLDEVDDAAVVDGLGDDEDGALDLVDGVDVVENDGVHEGEVEAVGGGDDDVEGGVLDVESTRAGQGVEEIEGLVLLCLLLLRAQRGGGGL